MNSKQVVLITGSSTGFGRLFAKTWLVKAHVFATMLTPEGAMPRCLRNPRACGKEFTAHSRLELD